MSLLNKTSNNENQSATIVFGVMRQNDGCIFNPSNALCGSIAFENLGSIEEALAICAVLNWAVAWDEELQADFSHPIEGESYIPIVLIGGVWYEIRGEENLPYRMSYYGGDEWFVNGLWSVETPPSPETILELGDMRQVSEFSKQYKLVTDDQAIGDILEDLGVIAPSQDNTPRASLFVLEKDGGMIEVWGSYQVAPELNCYTELIWHDQMTEAELKELEGRNPACSVVCCYGMGGWVLNECASLKASSWEELRKQIADLFTFQFKDWDNAGTTQVFFDTTLAKILLASVPEEIPYLGNYGIYAIVFSNWVVGESPTTPPSPTPPTEQEQESEEENHFSYEEGKTNKKNDKAEAALNEFMEALNSGNEEKLTEIANKAFVPLVYKIIPKDDDKEALLI